MITVKINENGCAMSGDGIKDFEKVTSKESMENIRKAAKLYVDEVVNPQHEHDKENMEKAFEQEKEILRIKTENEARLIKEREKSKFRADMKSAAVKLGLIAGGTAAFHSIGLGFKALTKAIFDKPEVKAIINKNPESKPAIKIDVKKKK